MSARTEEPNELKLMQGRWFHLTEDKPNRARPGDEIALKELPSSLPPQVREQLINKFMAVVSGEVAVSRGAVDADLREQNIAIMHRYIEYENARNYEGMESLFHPTEFRSKTYFGNDPISPKAHTRMLKGLFRAFPDWF